MLVITTLNFVMLVITTLNLQPFWTDGIIKK
jgi:hypothetical protein